jgi:hypothetical protein
VKHQVGQAAMVFVENKGDVLMNRLAWPIHTKLAAAYASEFNKGIDISIGDSFKLPLHISEHQLCFND